MWLEGVAQDVAWVVVGGVHGSRNGVGGVVEGVGVSLVVVRSPECRWWCLIVHVGGGGVAGGA